MDQHRNIDGDAATPGLRLGIEANRAAGDYKNFTACVVRYTSRGSVAELASSTA